jgi:hypothetical protein
MYSGAVRFEVEVLYRNETGEWVATAVEHGVTATGRTEKEALAILMERLSAHFKKSS